MTENNKDNDNKNNNGEETIVSMSEFKKRIQRHKENLEEKREQIKDTYVGRSLHVSNQNFAPAFNIPPVTKILFFSIIAVFALQYFGPMSWDYWMMQNLGFVPAKFSGAQPFQWWSALSPITHSFLHGSWMHLGMNALMLLAFGAGLERAVGVRHFLNIYFLGAVAGVVTQFILDPSSQAVMLGASGCISALFGAILLVLQKEGRLGPGARIMPFIILWIGISVFFGFFGVPGEEADIGWAAHLGGFFIGLAYANFSKI